MSKDLAPGALSEEIETIWRSLLASGLKSVAVTAAMAGEGTSTIAAALARRAQQSGETVLLAEIAPTKPRLFDRVGMPLSCGLPTRIGSDSFGVLSVPTNAPPNWQKRDFFAWRLAEWQRDWNMVVLDLPPVLTSPAPGLGMGSLSVCASAACTLMVVLAGHTKAEAVLKAQTRLDLAGANLLGIVMNDRENPSLKQELQREIGRIADFLPGITRRLQSRLQRLPVNSERLP